MRTVLILLLLSFSTFARGHLPDDDDKGGHPSFLHATGPGGQPFLRHDDTVAGDDEPPLDHDSDAESAAPEVLDSSSNEVIFENGWLEDEADQLSSSVPSPSVDLDLVDDENNFPRRRNHSYHGSDFSFGIDGDENHNNNNNNNAGSDDGRPDDDIGRFSRGRFAFQARRAPIIVLSDSDSSPLTPRNLAAVQRPDAEIQSPADHAVTCPGCEEGFLCERRRRSDDSPFFGCTKYCGYTENMPTPSAESQGLDHILQDSTNWRVSKRVHQKDGSVRIYYKCPHSGCKAKRQEEHDASGKPVKATFTPP